MVAKSVCEGPILMWLDVFEARVKSWFIEYRSYRVRKKFNEEINRRRQE